MTFRSSFCLFVTIVLLSSASWAEKHKAEAAALIEKATQISDIHAEGSAPFRLKMSYQVLKKNGPILQGVYTEVWVSKQQWRREIKLGDFETTHVVSGKKRWILDSNASVPEELGDVQLLFYFSRFQQQQWKSPKDREINGISVRCVSGSGSVMLCFNKSSGTMVSESSSAVLGASMVKRACLYSDYQKFGDRSVATSYECESTQSKLKARIVELQPEPTPDPALFAPLVGGKESINCLGSTKPPALTYGPPPKPLQNTGASPIVLISVLVDVNGTPRNPKVISAFSQEQAKAALDALQQWKYKPATCDGEPMEVQILVQVETPFHIY